MPHESSPRIRGASQAPVVLAVTFVCAFAVSTFATWTYKVELGVRLDRIEAMETRKMITTQWTSGSHPRTLTSKWREYDEAEEFDAFLVRHEAEVEAAQKRFKPDPQ